MATISVKQGREDRFSRIAKKLILCTVLFLVEGKVTVAWGSEQNTVLVLGDSLSAGYGLEEEQAYPALVQARINDARKAVQPGARAVKSTQIINAGISGDTSAGGLGRISWLLKDPVDVLLLELGTNDALRGLPIEMTESNLQQIIDIARARNPRMKIVIAGMMLPPNFGEQYAKEFKEIFPRLATKNNAVLIPFLLAGVAGDPALNFPDRLHPNEAGQKIVAETVWRYLEPILTDSSAQE